MHEKGYPDVAILHRLQIPLSESENRHTNPVKFYDLNTKLLYDQPMQISQLPYPQRNDHVAKGYYSGDELVQQSMNFSIKNRLAIEDLHNILKSVIFPESVKKSRRFNISKDDYNLVLHYMSQYPSETEFPTYDSANYWDAFGKFLYYGGEKGPLEKTLRSFNKYGAAYGFLIDAAYFADFSKKIEFMLTAVIYCNTDGILNDDKYDYGTIGLPFMKNLGKLIYYHELRRPQKFLPDLSKFDFRNRK